MVRGAVIGRATIEAFVSSLWEMEAPRPRSTAERLARTVLRAPGFVRRAAASQAKEPQEAWMLRQSNAVRQSFVREVLDRGGDPRLAEIWVLRQSDALRESYVRDVLEPRLPDHLRPGSG
jgi:hypothetical protein